MRKIPIEDLIQLLGMVGIIGSLIFVGLEMRQSKELQWRVNRWKEQITTNGFTAFNEAGLDWYSVAFLNRPELADQYLGIAAGRNNTKHFLYMKTIIFSLNKA